VAITTGKSAFVGTSSMTIGLSQMFSVTAGNSDPTYLVLSALDRNEYTAKASGAVGTLSGNGRTLSLSSIGGDGRGAGIVFTYQAATGRYYNATYGYFDQLSYVSSGSLSDVTNLSLFGTSNLAQATTYAGNAYAMMQVDAAGYLGSATVATTPTFTGTVPAQATPNAIAAAANSFVGQAWNMNGCWVLASSIAAEAGASLPVQSTAIGISGQANGEWIVAFNGPAGQSGNWQSLVHTGEVVVIGTSGGGGHITTCVSGSGSSAMLVDNITYVNSQGKVVNPANDGSNSDIIVAAPHAASQEWSGVQASSVVIYELDTPVVSATVASDSLACLATQSLASLFSASDPVSRAITAWQVYDTATGDSLLLNGTTYSAHSAASAVTAASLASVSLHAGATATSDTLEVRAFNGTYWGDWQSLAVSVTAAVASAPVVTMQTANQTWTGGKAVSLALPSATFSDPQHQALKYTATLSNGQALPGWLSFNAATETFSGTAPLTVQSLSIKVTATDTSALSASETFTATVLGAPTVTAQTPTQSWQERKTISLTLPASTFTDPQGQKLSYTATQSNGQALPSWLTFNSATETFSGTAPANAQSLSIKVTATDTSGLATSETFAAAVVPAAPTVMAQTANQSWQESKPFSFKLASNTFADPQGQTLSYSATQSNGQALPGWLAFSPSTETFSGLAPATAQSLSIKVTATDTSGLTASETFTASVTASPAKAGITVTVPTAAQTWTDGQNVDLVLPGNTFSDALGLKMSFAAYEVGGTDVTSWLRFNPATDEFVGKVPDSVSGTAWLEVVATDAQHMSATDLFPVTFVAGSAHVGSASTGAAGTTQSVDVPHLTELLAFHC